AGPQAEILDDPPQVARTAVLFFRTRQDLAHAGKTAAPQPDFGEVAKRESRPAGPVATGFEPQGMEKRALGAGEVAGSSPAEPELVPQARRLTASQPAAAHPQGTGDARHNFPAAVRFFHRSQRASVVPAPGEIRVVERRAGLLQEKIHGGQIAAVPGRA